MEVKIQAHWFGLTPSEIFKEKYPYMDKQLIKNFIYET